MGIRWGHADIVVRDMDAMAAFYNRLGVPIAMPPPEWAPHHRNSGGQDGWDVDLDSQQFAAVWNEGWPGGPGIVLVFRVDSREEVDDIYRDLTDAGYASQQPPYDAFWGSRFAVISDPDGHAVGLMSAPEEAYKAAPPTPPFDVQGTSDRG
jgi:catechol 2,3-dioxygenase-like lactoylglutathione lyase family enzyme